MRIYLLLVSILVINVVAVQAQDNRVEYNDKQLFLSGSNIAWVTFAYDIGPGQTDFDQFEQIFQNAHANGANTMRLWLHINGEHTPAFDSNGMVTGPGEGTIQDVERILDLAHENEIGLMLTLWSFDMLRESFGEEVTSRAQELLQDSAHTASYINNSLIPMVDSLQGHPGIQSWEIFNEPEGMSHEHGWDGFKKVSMNTIQRFVNRTAGAIHRTDSTAKVTNGTWSFIAASDVDGNTNYYRDDRLIEAGGDSLGTLDFYTVHYYDWGGTELSPFHHPKSYWELDKPLVVAEFHPYETFGVAADNLYNNLYQNGYAGALAWSWATYSDESRRVVNENTNYLWNNYPEAIDPNPNAGDPPSISLVSPENYSEFPADTTINLEAEASDSDGQVTKVEFIKGDSLIAEVSSQPYSYQWDNAPKGNYRIKAVATDDSSMTSESEPALITVGVSDRTRFEAENAAISGSGLSVENGTYASGGSYVAMDSQSGTIEWTLSGIPEQDSYTIVFGYSISSGAGDKTQYLRVNGSNEREVEFINTSDDWRERRLSVNLNEGVNTVTIEGYWGYMDFDYLAVDTSSGAANAGDPPSVSLLSPENYTQYPADTTITLEAEASDPDGQVTKVEFMKGDSLIAEVSSQPYSYQWDNPSQGKYSINAVATDDSSMTSESDPILISVGASGQTLYEAEDAVISGSGLSVEDGSNASGGSYVAMESKTGTIEWTLWGIPEQNSYTIAFGYSIASGAGDKTQYLTVNGSNERDVEFINTSDEWREHTLSVNLNEGVNTVTIEGSWGYMDFDYLSVDTNVVSTDIEPQSSNAPDEFQLRDNYPNPFNPQTVIPYELSKSGQVTLKVYDVTGRMVKTLVNQHQSAGSYQATFKADNLSSGIYLYRLNVEGQFRATRRMLLVK